MKVKAAVIRARDGHAHIEGLELADPASDEILVRLVACGVGRADLDAIAGRLAMPLPFVPGTEGAGVVEKVGDAVTTLAPGDAVLLGAAHCGACEPCRAGRFFACTHFDALNLSGRRPNDTQTFETRGVHGVFFGQSAMATHAICAARHAHRLEADAPLEILAALGHEIVRGAGVVLDGFRLQAGDTLVVLGANALGLAATMAAKAMGAKLVLVADPDERRREMASAVGADVTAHGQEHLAELFESLEAKGADFALDAIGDAVSRSACLESVIAGGTCAFVAPPPDTMIGATDQRPHGAPLVLSVDACRTEGTVDRLLALYRDGSFPLEKIIDFFPFEHADDALVALRRGDVAKPVLRFSLGAFDELDRAKTEGAAEDVETDDAPEGRDETERRNREPAIPPVDVVTS